MKRRYNLVHLVLGGVIVLGLTPMMVVVGAQAQITFVSHRDGNPEIYLMDLNGKNQHRLTNNRDQDWYPSWSPDGEHIVFASERDRHIQVKHGWLTSEIYVMDADGGNPQNLTNHPEDDGSPSWSPDGKRIVFMSDRDEPLLYFDIYVMDADGNNLQRLTNNPRDDRDPSWSPDGKRIVFRARRDEHFENKFGITYEIYAMDTNGKNQQRLTENRVYDWYPSWSPDGKQIAFAFDRNGNLENFDIYVMDADGGNPQRLTENRHVDSRPAWLNSPFLVSPAGKKITMWGRLKQIDR